MIRSPGRDDVPSMRSRAVLSLILATMPACGADDLPGTPAGTDAIDLDDERADESTDEGTPDPDGSDASSTGASSPDVPPEDDGAPEPDTGEGSTTDDGDPTPSDPSACSGFQSGAAFGSWINELRDTYASHDRWRGPPVGGTYHGDWTFPPQFQWDDELAAEAQARAATLAAGGMPTGLGYERVWFDGIDTAAWTITVLEQPGDFEDIPFTFGDKPFPLHKSNPIARKGLHYHDFGGAEPTIGRMGIAAAVVDEASCHVWWVIRFGS